MTDISFSTTPLSESEQAIVTNGFEQHSQQFDAPAYEPESYTWRLTDDNGELIGVLTAKLLWDWLYIDELWVSESSRASGLGKTLMQKAEQHAIKEGYCGIWLWTQSWQAESFYLRLGYKEFCRFPNFPNGFERIGLRKELN